MLLTDAENLMADFLNRPALMLLALAFLVACGGEPPPSAVQVPRVKVYEVGEQTAGQLRRISGKLVSEDTSRLSFNVPGTVAEVLVVQGQVVQAGEVLARLDPEPKVIAVNQARARLTVARANKIEARQNYERLQELFERNYSSRADLEAAEANYSAASGNLAAAESELEQDERDLARTELVAPFTGSIASRSVDPFQEVSGGEEVFVLQSDQALKVEVLVPETLIRIVDYGQPVQVTLPSLQDELITGTVSEIASRAESGNAFPVSVQLATSGLDLRPGMTAGVTFNFESYSEGGPVYLIPLSALALEYGVVQGAQQNIEESTAPVFIVDDDNRIQVRTVSIGDLRGDMLEVFRGLEAGERVVSAGVSFLREGMQVELWTQQQGLTRG
jgi:RND family efflux transporter MFP subunit